MLDKNYDASSVEPRIAKAWDDALKKEALRLQVEDGKRKGASVPADEEEEEEEEEKDKAQEPSATELLAAQEDFGDGEDDSDDEEAGNGGHSSAQQHSMVMDKVTQGSIEEL